MEQPADDAPKKRLAFVPPAHMWNKPEIQGKLLKKGTFGWKEKWAVLQYNKIHIFDKESDMQSKTVPKQSIHLTRAKVESTKTPKGYGIAITEAHNGKTVVLAPCPDTQMDLWQHAINESQPKMKPQVTEPPVRFSEVPKMLKDCMGRGDPRDSYSNAKFVGKGKNSIGIYRANDLKNRREVAIKMVRLGDEQNLHYFVKEVQFQHSISHHPNICSVHEVFYLKQEKQFWLIMDFCERGPLSNYLKKIKGNEQKMAYVCREMLKALKVIHESNHVHRDIKSDNVLIGLGGEIKLADFGFVSELDRYGRRYTKCGTVFWMPPEMIESYSYNKAADIYSLGITLLEMCDGLPPYVDLPLPEASALLRTKGAPLPKSSGKYSQQMLGFLTMCTAYDPRYRATAEELLGHPWIQSCRAESVNVWE